MPLRRGLLSHLLHDDGVLPRPARRDGLPRRSTSSALSRPGGTRPNRLPRPHTEARTEPRKRRAKTDRTDARWLRQVLCEGRLPQAWAPPEHVRQWRSRARLRSTLVDERTSWTQRIRATLYHHGVASSPAS